MYDKKQTNKTIEKTKAFCTRVLKVKSEELQNFHLRQADFENFLLPFKLIS